MSNTVTIKQIPDEIAALTGLDKYNRSKMPGTSDFLQPGELAGRKVTGLDEDAFEIQIMTDDDEKQKKRSEIKSLRETLQRATGHDLSATSAFWDSFGVRLYADEDLVLNMASPIDVIKHRVLIANNYAAPDKESASLPQYRFAKYYCYVEDRVNAEEVSTQKTKDKARAELLKLSENKDKMVLVGQYLEGDKYKAKMKENTLYKMLSDYISDPRDVDAVKKFLKATTVSPEDLQYKITVDRALKKKVIRFSDGYYQRGQVTLGKTPFELYENLKKPEFAMEFLSIKDEVESE